MESIFQEDPILKMTKLKSSGWKCVKKIRNLSFLEPFINPRILQNICQKVLTFSCQKHYNQLIINYHGWHECKLPYRKWPWSIIFTGSGFKQILNTPTCITDQTSTLIDLIFVNNNQNISYKTVIPTGLSDHDLIACVRKVNNFSMNQKQYAIVAITIMTLML